MLRKALVLSLAGFLSAVAVPAKSFAISGYFGTPQGASYSARFDQGGTIGSMSGVLNTIAGGEALMYYIPSDTGEFVWLDQLFTQFMDKDETSSSIIFSSDPEILPSTLVPSSVNNDFEEGLLKSGDKVYGDCYFVAYLHRSGTASYEYGYGMSGDGEILCIFGSAKMSIKRYQDIFALDSAAITPETPLPEPGNSNKPMEVTVEMTPAGADILPVSGDVADWANAQPAVGSIHMLPIKFYPYIPR